MSHPKRSSSQTSPPSNSKRRLSKKNKPDQENEEEESVPIADKWTLEELDLSKEIVSLYSLLGDKQLLVEKLFSILSSREIKQMTPKTLKDIPFSILKDICIIQLKDNSIVSDEEIIATLVDAERNFDVKHNPEPELKPKVVQEEGIIDDSALDHLVKNGAKKDEVVGNLMPDEEIKNQNDEVDDEAELAVDNTILPVDFHKKLKDSFVSQGLCTFEDLDLEQPITPLESVINERETLWELVLKLVPTEELLELLPQVLKKKPLDQLKNEIRQVISNLSREVIEAVLNESNPSLNQESSSNLIKSDCSTKGVKNNNEELESGGMGARGRDEVEGKLNDDVKGKETQTHDEEGSNEQQEKKEKKDEENPCNDEDLAASMVINEKEEANEGNSGRDGVENDYRQKIEGSSRLSPDDELMQLEKKARAIREMLKAVEEEEARLRAQKLHDNAEPRESSGKKQGENNESQPETSENVVDGADDPKILSEIESDLLINRIVNDDDDDSIDRELKGLD